jgi:DNA-binding LytR/AlgR family response regulator
MPTALIADDEPHLATHLRDQLAAVWPQLSVIAIARNGVEAAEAIARLRPDVAFLDIQMPGATGLEVAQGIEGATRVVFVTAFDQYAVDAFERNAIDYLLKPVKADRLGRTIAKLREAFDRPGHVPIEDERLAAVLQRLLSAGGSSGASATAAPTLRWIRASAGDLTHQIDVNDVLFFRVDDKYITVQTATGGEHLIRTPIAELAAQLDPQQFRQVHRSTIVNLAALAGTRRDDTSRLFIRVKGFTQELPVSRAYVHLFKAM